MSAQHAETTPTPGFADPVLGAQAAFRRIMTAMAEPAQPVAMDDVAIVSPPRGLTRASAAIALTLLDFETPVFLGPGLDGDDAIAAFLDFHTGAPRTAEPRQAAFAFLNAGDGMPPLADFSAGEPDYPDRSATLVLQVTAFADSGLMFDGPGFAAPRGFSIAPPMADFEAQWHANRTHFPCGIDLLFASDDAVAALPRSTNLRSA